MNILRMIPPDDFPSTSSPQEEIKNVLIKDYGAEWFKKMVKPLTSSLKMNM